MTRERKELKKKMMELEMQENAEYELGCGFFSEEIRQAFEPYWKELTEKWAATYGMTVEQYYEHIYKRQSEAYDAGRIQWSPCYGA